MATSEPKRGTNHLCYVEKQERQADYDTGDGDTGNERSFDSHGSQMRDQGIQSGNGNIRRIAPRQMKSTTKPAAKITQSQHWKYESPYVQAAKLIAQARANQHKDARNKQQRQQREWNTNSAPTGSLFDPTIHKQEIFKLQPRNRASIETKQGTNTATRNNSAQQDQENNSLSNNNARTRITMRASSDGPLTRRTTAYASIPARRTSSGTSPMQSREGALGSDHENHNKVRSSAHGTASGAHNDSPVTSSHAVTRSTSPISEHVVSSILQEDGLVNDDDFTIHIKSIQNGILDPSQPFESNPKDQEHYTKYLRQRLRDILIDHNDASSDSSDGDREVEVTDYEDLNTSEEHCRHSRGGRSRSRCNNYAEHKYLRRKDGSHSRHSSRHGSLSRGGSRSASRNRGGATEELMASMAQIMTAVGSIVTKKSRNPYKSVLRKHARRQRQEQDMYSTSYAYPEETTQMASEVRWAGTRPAPTAPVRRGLGGPLGGPLDGPVNRAPKEKDVLAGVGAPRTRAEMLDAIMAKLQEMELNELQIKEYLARSTNRPSELYVQDLSAEDVHTHYKAHCTYELAVSSPGQRHARHSSADDQSSVAVEALSEGEAEGEENAQEQRSATAPSAIQAARPTPHSQLNRAISSTDSSTQDSEHTLELLHKRLALDREVAARGSSVASLQAQERQLHTQSSALTAEQLRQKEVAHLQGLTKLPQDYQSNQTILSYMKELDFCREMKDVAFRSRGVSMAQVADRMAEEICARLVSSVANELDDYIGDYSEKFLDKI